MKDSQHFDSAARKGKIVDDVIAKSGNWPGPYRLQLLRSGTMMRSNARHFGQLLHAVFGRVHEPVSGRRIALGEISGEGMQIGYGARSKVGAIIHALLLR